MRGESGRNTRLWSFVDRKLTASHSKCRLDNTSNHQFRYPKHMPFVICACELHERSTLDKIAGTMKVQRAKPWLGAQSEEPWYEREAILSPLQSMIFLTCGSDTALSNKDEGTGAEE